MSKYDRSNLSLKKVVSVQACVRCGYEIGKYAEGRSCRCFAATRRLTLVDYACYEAARKALTQKSA